MSAVLLTPKQVAALRGCSESKLRAERERREGIPFVRDGASVRYLKSDVEDFILSLPRTLPEGMES